MLVWPDSLTGIEPCMFCAGTGWVCEVHGGELAGHDGCHGGRMPCLLCRPRMPELESTCPVCDLPMILVRASATRMQHWTCPTCQIDSVMTDEVPGTGRPN